MKDNSRIKEDTAMGIVFSGMFALGLVLYASEPTDVHLDHLLFGDTLASPGPTSAGAPLACRSCVAVLLGRRGLMLHTFDPAHARAIGLPVRALALRPARARRAHGGRGAAGGRIILAIAAPDHPRRHRLPLGAPLRAMLAVAAGLAVAASLLGVYASFWLDSAPAPTIVLVLSLAFVASLALTHLARPAAAR